MNVKKEGLIMRFKLKEDEILEFLDLNFPQQTFEKGRLLTVSYTHLTLPTNREV